MREAFLLAGDADLTFRDGRRSDDFRRGDVACCSPGSAPPGAETPAGLECDTRERVHTWLCVPVAAGVSGPLRGERGCGTHGFGPRLEGAGAIAEDAGEVVFGGVDFFQAGDKCGFGHGGRVGDVVARSKAGVGQAMLATLVASWAAK